MIPIPPNGLDSTMPHPACFSRFIARFLGLAGCALISVFSADAQLSWTCMDSLFGSLPNDFHVYRTQSPLDGKPNVAWYVSANLRDPQLSFTTQVGYGKRMTPQQFFEQENKPLLVVNGTFFSFTENRNLNIVVRNGKLMAYQVPSVRKAKDTTQYYYVTRGAIGIDRQRRADVAWVYTDTARKRPLALTRGPSVAVGPDADPDWKQLAAQIKHSGRKKRTWRMQTAIGGGPVLITDGKISITNVQERMFVNGEKDKHPRTAMGYTPDGRLIVLAVEGRHPGVADGVTLNQEAVMLKELGCTEALNLDGGGSSCMLVNGKETIRPSDKEGQRAVPAVFLIYPQKIFL